MNPALKQKRKRVACVNSGKEVRPVHPVRCGDEDSRSVDRPAVQLKPLLGVLAPLRIQCRESYRGWPGLDEISGIGIAVSLGGAGGLDIRGRRGSMGAGE